ncbi:MAG: hypothetical protein JWN36_3260 [Microbacteriaceae bacterium]|nr:hypothetical protein [Microbacteriaceae bacterium]
MRIAVVFLSVLVLTGCVGSDPTVTPAPTPTSTPLFASDAEALKAAEAAYKRYTDVTVSLLTDGGDYKTELPKVVTGALLKADLKTFDAARSAGLKASGSVTYRNFRIETIEAASDEPVRAYVCEDVSQFRLVDSSGNSVVSKDRPDTATYELAFQLVGDHELRISHDEVWSTEPC